MNDEQAYFEYLTNRNRLSLLIRKIFVNDLVRHFTGRVLDLGCGIGEFLTSYSNSIGLDVNFYAARHCVKQGATCCLGDVYRLPFSDQAFDGVLASNVLEHLADVGSVVQEVSRIIRPGGKLVITVPLEAGFQRDATHETFLRKRDLQEFARFSALMKISDYTFPLPWSWPGRFLYFWELRVVFVKNEFG